MDNQYSKDLDLTPVLETKFYVGQLVRHRLFEYRGVVVGVDPHFKGSEKWYEENARSRPPKNKPWYHVLVDGSDIHTYVAERNLEKEKQPSEIDHPMIARFFERFKDGRYIYQLH